MIGPTLTDSQLSVVDEMVNIGCSHAATALNELTLIPYRLTPTSSHIGDMDQISTLLGNIKSRSLGVVMFVERPMSAYFALIFPWQSAVKLWEHLMIEAPSETEKVSEICESALLEVGNILHSAFLNSFSEMLDAKFDAALPCVADDSVAAIVYSLFANAEFQGSMGLYTNTQIIADNKSIECHFLCIPTREGLNFLIQNLQKEELLNDRGTDLSRSS